MLTDGCPAKTRRMQLSSVPWDYNDFLAFQHERYENKTKLLSFFDIGRKLVELRASDLYS